MNTLKIHSVKELVINNSELNAPQALQLVMSVSNIDPSAYGQYENFLKDLKLTVGTSIERICHRKPTEDEVDNLVEICKLLFTY